MWFRFHPYDGCACRACGGAQAVGAYCRQRLASEANRVIEQLAAIVADAVDLLAEEDGARTGNLQGGREIERRHPAVRNGRAHGGGVEHTGAAYVGGLDRLSRHLRG